MNPSDFRQLSRKGEWTKPTSGQCPGYQQANMVILPASFADDFEAFCRHPSNKQACPLLERLITGSPHPLHLSSSPNGIDVRSDLPLYRIYRHGVLEKEVNDITHLWRDDLVTFFLGCSFSFERALQDAGIPVRNIDERKNVSMYKTNIQCTPVGPFSCPMVVSMRPVPPYLVETAKSVSDRFSSSHGAPIHCGDPSVIGISNLEAPDFGDAVTVKQDEVPCFWACGVTSTLAALSAKPDIVITHAPGHMLVTDLYEPL